MCTKEDLRNQKQMTKRHVGFNDILYSVARSGVQDRVRFRGIHRVRYSADNAFRFRLLFHRAILQIVSDDTHAESSANPLRAETVSFSREGRNRFLAIESIINDSKPNISREKCFLFPSAILERKHRWSRYAPQSSCDQLLAGEWKKAIENRMQINHGQQWSHCLRNLRIGSRVRTLVSCNILFRACPEKACRFDKSDPSPQVKRRGVHWRAAEFFSVTTIFQTKGRVKRRIDGKISFLAQLHEQIRFLISTHAIHGVYVQVYTFDTPNKELIKSWILLFLYNYLLHQNKPIFK